MKILIMAMKEPMKPNPTQPRIQKYERFEIICLFWTLSVKKRLKNLQ